MSRYQCFSCLLRERKSSSVPKCKSTKAESLGLAMCSERIAAYIHRTLCGKNQDNRLAQFRVTSLPRLRYANEEKFVTRMKDCSLREWRIARYANEEHFVTRMKNNWLREWRKVHYANEGLFVTRMKKTSLREWKIVRYANEEKFITRMKKSSLREWRKFITWTDSQKSGWEG